MIEQRKEAARLLALSVEMQERGEVLRPTPLPASTPVLVTLEMQRVAQRALGNEPECKYPETGATMRKWIKGLPLTAEEQRVVNDVGDGQRQFTSHTAQAEVFPTTKNPFEVLREHKRPKHPKHAAANLRKVVESASASLGSNPVRAQPESSVGSSLPIQWSVTPGVWAEGNWPVGPEPEHDDPAEAALLQRFAVLRAPDALGAVAPAPDVPGAAAPVRACDEEEAPVYPRRTYGMLEEAPPTADLIGYHERRTIEVRRWETKVFPELDFIGLWNNSRFSTSETINHVRHLGFHFHERDMEVVLPAGLVAELKDFWTDKNRDVSMQNFSLCVARSRVLTSELIMTPDQLYAANLYAPAMAFIESWDAQQNVTRVAMQHYASSGVLTSVRKTGRALRTKRGALLGVAVLTVSAVLVWGAVVLRRKVRHNLAARAVARDGQAMQAEFAKAGVPFWIPRGESVVHKVRRWLGWLPTLPALAIRHDVRLQAGRLVGVELNPGPVLSTSEVLRRAMHYRKLVNCVELPRPERLKPGAKLKWSDGGLRENVRIKPALATKGVHETVGFDTKHYAPTAFASNKHNEEQALLARVLMDTVEPTDNLTQCLDWCKRNHRDLFPHMHKVQSVSFSEYLRRSNASPSVKRTLQAAQERLTREGITEDSALTRSQLYRYTYRSSFVKTENDLYTSPLGRKNKAPRLIQGAQAEFIVLVGPWIMALQDLLKRRWNTRNSNLVFTSGVSAEQAAAFICGGAGPWVEDDLGKFDSTIRRPWCEYEVWLCEKFGAPRAVLDLMRANIATHGSTLHGWRYKCDGTRKSGDPYTSLMNSIINVLSHLYLYCSWTGHSVLSARKTLRMLAQGDDNCMRHLERVQFPWQAGMATLGFESEALYRQRIDQVEFCSCRIYETSGGVVFGPKPGRVLAKMGYVVNPPQHVSQGSLMRGIALGLRRQCNFIPPLRVAVERILEITKADKAWFQRKQFAAFDEEKLRMVKYYEESVEVMCNLDMNYQWDYGKQAVFSSDLSRMQFGDKMTGLCELLFDRDTGGPQAIFGGWVSQAHPTPAA